MQQFLLMYFLVLFLCDLIIHLDARKCYVCGPKSFEPFRSIKDKAEKLNHTTTNNNNYNNDEEMSEIYTKSCEILDKLILNDETNLMKDFVKECPPNYSGCLTQTDVNQTTRTCELVAFNDCHPANGVLYCYCSDDLCNEKKTSTAPDKPKINFKNDHNRFSDEDDSDDEDNSDEESSGMEEKFNNFNKKTKGILSDKNNSSINSFQINYLVGLIALKFFI